MGTKVASFVGDYLSADEAGRAEKALPAGPYELRAYLFKPLSQEEIDKLQADLIAGGVQLTAPLSETIDAKPTLYIQAMKPQATAGVGFFWIPIIALLSVGAVGYGLYRLPTIMNSITNLIIPLGLLVIGGMIVYGVFVSKKRA